MHVKPNCEKQVATYLLNRNISYYLPLYERKTKYGYWGRIRTNIVPLFSGYLCFALDRERHACSTDTKKVVRIIKVDDQESFVKELEAIARAIETGELEREARSCARQASADPLRSSGRNRRSCSSKAYGAPIGLSVKMFNQTVLVKLDPWTKIEPL